MARTKVYIRIISLVLSFLMTWQSIAYADPDIFSKRDLQPESMFDTANRNSGFAVSLAGYILNVLLRIEAVDDNRNLYSMKAAVDKELKLLKMSGKLSDDMAARVPDSTDGLPESGAFVVDLGASLYRYYDQGFPGAGEVSDDLRIMEDVKVGEYISRQKLMRKKLADGLVAKGDDELLYKTFMGGSYVTGGLRESLKSRMPELVVRIKSLLKGSEIKDDTRSVLEAAVDRLSSASFVEFKPLVIPDEKDPTISNAWILGFSTLRSGDKGQDEQVSGLETMLGKTFPDTVGLSSRLVDMIEEDELLLLEYLFHEAACSLFGHHKTRELQEQLFPENYRRVYGDVQPGHKDGELALVLKQVVWEGCEQPLADELDGHAINADFEKFQEEDFTKDGPQKATAYYSRYKRWYEWVRRFMMTSLSRLKKSDHEQVAAILESMDKRYNYIVAKLAWVWNMEMSWNKADEVIRGRDFGALSVEEKAKVMRCAEELLSAHVRFMKTSPWAKYIKNDLFVDRSVADIEEILGRRRIDVHFAEEPAVIVPIKVEAKEEVKKEEKGPERPGAAKEQPAEPPSEAAVNRVMRFDWGTLAGTMAASLAVSAVLYLLLPVNTVTLIIAFAVPVAFFVYLLARNWSWTNFFVAVGVSAALSFLVPVPWFGLAIAIVTLGVMAARKAPSGVPAAAGQKAPSPRERPEAAGAAATAVTKGAEAPSEKEVSDVKFGGIDLSPDVFNYFWKIIRAMNRGAKAEPSGSEEAPDVDTHTILDALFLGEAGEKVKVDDSLKRALRPLVKKQIEQLETGFNFELKRSMDQLKAWRSHGDDTLATALSEVTQEVASSITSWSFGADTRHEMIAIQELAGEYYGIEKRRFSVIRLKLVLNVMREQTSSEETIGHSSPENYYFLGSLEFHFRNYKEAELAFSKAVGVSPTDADYLFTLGILEHYLKKWDPASKAYRFSLNLRQLEPGKKEADKLKLELLELLIKKTDARIALDGKEEGGYPSLEGAPATISILKKLVKPQMLPELYSTAVAPVLEQVAFTQVPLIVIFTIASFGHIGFWGMLAAISSVQGLFVLLHLANPVYFSGSRSLFWKARYILTAPSVVAFTAIGASSLASAAQLSFSWQPFGIVLAPLLATAVYFVSSAVHKKVNELAWKEGDYAPATAGEGRYRHIEPENYLRVMREFFVAGILTARIETGADLIREIARKAVRLKALHLRYEEIAYLNPDALKRMLILPPSAPDKNMNDEERSIRNIREMLFVNGIDEVSAALGIDRAGDMGSPLRDPAERRHGAAALVAREPREAINAIRKQAEEKENLQRFRHEREKLLARKHAVSAMSGSRTLEMLDEAEKRFMAAVVYLAYSKKEAPDTLRENAAELAVTALTAEAPLKISRENIYAKKQTDAFLEKKIFFGPRIVSEYASIISKLGWNRDKQNSFYKSVISSMEELLRSKGLESKLVVAFKTKCYAPVGEDPISTESDGLIKGMMAAALSLNDDDIKNAVIRMAGQYIAAQRRGRGEGSAPATILSIQERIAPKMDIEKYAKYVAPWVEEGIFFALPLVIGNWLFGLDSLGTIALMAAARTIFFFAHPGARPHAPPAAYRTPLTVAVSGFLISLLPVVAAMSSSGLSTVDSGLSLSFTLSPLFLITASSGASMLVHYLANKAAISEGHVPADLESAGEGTKVLSGPALIKEKTNSVLPDVPVMEEQYTPVSHFKTYIRELREAWHGRQYGYAFVDALILFLQLRVPNAQWVYAGDNNALEKVVIRSGGWSLSSLWAVIGIGILASGVAGSGTLVFLTAIAMINVFGADVIFDILLARAAASHEWLHAYQGKIAERARREGRITNTRDFLSDNMTALEMIGKYNHKTVTEETLGEVEAFVESLIERMLSDQTRPAPEEPAAKPLSDEARAYFPDAWISAFKMHRPSDAEAKRTYARFTRNIDFIFSKRDEGLRNAFVEILESVDMKGYLESMDTASSEAKAEAFGALVFFVECASGPDGYAYCKKILSNMKLLSDFGVVKKEDFKIVFRSSPFVFLRTLFNDRSARKYLIFTTLIEEGYLTYDEFIKQAAPNFHRAGDFYDKLAEEDESAPGGSPAISTVAVKFFDALGGKKAFSSAWDSDMIELLVALSGGRDTAAYYVISAFSWTKDPIRYAGEGLPALEKIAGKENLARLWEADPAQFINILAYFRENFSRSQDVEGDFNRHFNRVGRMTGKEPADFLREVWSDLASSRRSAFDRPFGLEIEILQEQSRKYGMERPKVAEDEHPLVSSDLIEAGLSNPDPEARRFMMFLMMMQTKVKGETSASLHPNDPNVRMMELIPPLFWDYGSGQRFVGYLRSLGLVGARTPMDINIVLPDTTDMDALRRFQFVKHILYTPEERLRQFGDILKPDLRESIRTKDDFTSIREKDNAGGYARFEDRLNSCNEGSLKYHQLMWEAFARRSSDERLKSALDKYDEKMKSWFVEVISKRAGFGEWAIGWLASAGIKYSTGDTPGDVGMKLAAIDIGLPDNKEKFLHFIGKLDEKETSALREIVRVALDEIDGILNPGLEKSAEPAPKPQAPDESKSAEYRGKVLVAIREQVDADAERLGDISRSYRYKDAVHREDYTFISDRYYHATTPEGLIKILTSMEIDPKQSFTGAAVMVNRAAIQHVMRWEENSSWRFIPEFTKENNIALEFIPTQEARDAVSIVMPWNSKDALWARFDKGLDLRPAAGMVAGKIRVIVSDLIALPEVTERVKSLESGLKAAGLDVEVISMPALETEILMQRNAYHKVLEASGAKKAKELREKIKRGENVKVLFVCLMNAQRSFLMHMVSDRLIREEIVPNISVSSRGITAFSGYPHQGLKEVCAKKGVDPLLLSTFRTTQVSEQDLMDADYVIMSDDMVNDNLSGHFPEYAGKLLYASDLAPRMVAGIRDLVDELEGKPGQYMPDYTHVADKLTEEQYYDLVYAALRSDLLGLSGTPENAEGTEKEAPGTAVELKDIKEEIGGILSGLGYSAESAGKMPFDLVLLGYEVKHKFPNLKAQISSGDIKAARKTLQDIVWLLKDRGYRDIANPNSVTRYLVNALGDGDIFDAIANAKDVPKNDARRAAEQLVTCTSISQVMYIALKLLGVENVGAAYAPEHIMLSVGTAPGRIFFIDPTMAEFREVETGKYYDTFTGTAYMSLKPEYLLNSPRDAIVLSRFYYYVRVTMPQALTASKHKNRGDAYAAIGKPGRAVAEYAKALEIDPNDSDVHNNLGNIYFGNGDLAKAIEEYTIALKLNTVSGYAYLNRGNAFMKTGEPEKAADDYKAAMKYMETPDEAEEKLGEAFAAIREKKPPQDPAKRAGGVSGPVTIGDLTIEDPVPDDAPAIKELSREIFGDYDAITIPGIIRTMDEARSEGVPTAYIKVCRSQGKVVGYILAKADFAAELFGPGSPGMWLNIRQIAVHKDFRRQGIGGILCDRVMELAWADGYGALCMPTASESEYSSKIAERRGFVYDTFAGMYVLKTAQGEPGAARSAAVSSLSMKRIMLRAKYVIPALINSLITVSRKNEKTILAIDLGLGEGEVNAMIKQLAEALSSVERNNEDLKRFFRNLEIIKGEGEVLAERVSNLTDPDKGAVKPENVIVITKNDNVKLYGSVEGRGVIAGIEDSGFSKAAYMPLFEIMLFAIGKSLGWDEKTLKEHYAMIPNVTASDKLSAEELAALFGADRKTLVIKLIPDAVEFNDKEFMEIIHSLKVMLARA